jgi:hypothetical protein
MSSLSSLETNVSSSEYRQFAIASYSAVPRPMLCPWIRRESSVGMRNQSQKVTGMRNDAGQFFFNLRYNARCAGSAGSQFSGSGGSNSSRRKLLSNFSGVWSWRNLADGLTANCGVTHPRRNWSRLKTAIRKAG